MYCGESIHDFHLSAPLKAVKKITCLATVTVTLILILTFYLIQVNRCVFCCVGIADSESHWEGITLPKKSGKICLV